MTRPCFLVVDREFSSNISTRKLVIETAKFNVITAYSGSEAIDTLQRFPAVDGVILDTGMRDMTADDAVAAIKQFNPRLTVIAICHLNRHCASADYQLEFFDTPGLLRLLERLQPQAVASIHHRNESLSSEEERISPPPEDEQ